MFYTSSFNKYLIAYPNLLYSEIMVYSRPVGQLYEWSISFLLSLLIYFFRCLASARFEVISS